MRIGVLAGEIPPPFFLHQLLYAIAEKGYEVIIYGSLVQKKINYINGCNTVKKYQSAMPYLK